MVAKEKSTRPKIRVEEIEDAGVESSDAKAMEGKEEKEILAKSEETEKVEESPPAGADVKRSILEPPKVSSFSQLDTPPSPSGKAKEVSEENLKETEPEKIWEE